MRTALILAGHGSHMLPETAGIIWEYVDRLRSLGVADEVTATFWKEQPEFSQVLKTLVAETIVVVPLFTSSGYFVNRVIPTEMNLDGAVTKRDGCTIHLTAPLGDYPAMGDVVRKRVQDVLTGAELDATETAVAIIGHGTPRTNSTQMTAQSQAETIRELDIVAQVVDAYLEDDPKIDTIFERTSAPHLIAVPFFLAQGSHVVMDIPAVLGITYGTSAAQVHGRTLYYTPPIGTAEVVVNFILEMIADYGLQPSADESKAEAHMPQVGQSLLRDQLAQAGQVNFGQLRITSDDIAPVQSSRKLQLETLAGLRAHVRDAPFRPLASLADLPTDWYFPITDTSQIPAVIETIYPAALADWATQKRDTMTVVPLETIRAREHGMYQSLPTDEVAQIIQNVCGDCIKHPLWHDSHLPADDVPCTTPCNYLLSALPDDD